MATGSAMSMTNTYQPPAGLTILHASVRPTRASQTQLSAGVTARSLRRGQGHDAEIAPASRPGLAPLQVAPAPERPLAALGQGTRIKTIDGEKPVETLVPGDLVMTLDNGFQPLRWIGHTGCAPSEQQMRPALGAVKIRAGALGVALPAQDVTVSAGYRVLVQSRFAERLWGCKEVLIAAGDLVGLTGVTRSSATAALDYWQLLFDQHQIIWANGMQAESLFAGPDPDGPLARETRADIARTCPALLDAEVMREAARPIPSQPGDLCCLLAHSQHEADDAMPGAYMHQTWTGA
jgi:hypothetical protein